MAAAMMVPLPKGEDVAAYLGEPPTSDLAVTADQFVTMTASLVKSYTRGEGFDVTAGTVADDLHAVIIMAAARLTQNPEQDKRVQFGDYSVMPQTSWTLVEQSVMNRYRRRAI